MRYLLRYNRGREKRPCEIFWRCRRRHDHFFLKQLFSYLGCIRSSLRGVGFSLVVARGLRAPTTITPPHPHTPPHPPKPPALAHRILVSQSGFKPLVWKVGSFLKLIYFSIIIDIIILAALGPCFCLWASSSCIK